MNSVESSVTRLYQVQEPAHIPDGTGSREPPVRAIIGATLDEGSNEGYFGSLSAGTFLQSLNKWVQKKISGTSEQPASRRHFRAHPLPSSGHNVVQSEPVEYVLPSRRLGGILMSCYWGHIHVLYPYLDKMQIEEDYEKLWKADSSITDEKSFLCLINAVFALSA